MPFFLVAQNCVQLIWNDVIWNRACRSCILKLSEELVELFDVTPLYDEELAGISDECHVDHYRFGLDDTRLSADVVVDIGRANTQAVKYESDFGRISSLCCQVILQNL